MDFGVAPVVGIVVVTFLCCMPLCISGKFKDEWIPLAAGVIGLILGIVCWQTGISGFENADWLTAAITGIVSGWAAVGFDQSVKQNKKT